MLTIAPGITIDINTGFLAFKILLLILSILSFIFSLVIVRQVSLMTESLVTDIDPVISLSSVFYAVLSLGIVMLFVKLF